METAETRDDIPPACGGGSVGSHAKKNQSAQLISISSAECKRGEPRALVEIFKTCSARHRNKQTAPFSPPPSDQWK